MQLASDRVPPFITILISLIISKKLYLDFAMPILAICFYYERSSRSHRVLCEAIVAKVRVLVNRF